MPPLPALRCSLLFRAASWPCCGSSTPSLRLCTGFPHDRLHHLLHHFSLLSTHAFGHLHHLLHDLCLLSTSLRRHPSSITAPFALLLWILCDGLLHTTWSTSRFLNLVAALCRQPCSLLGKPDVIGEPFSCILCDN